MQKEKKLLQRFWRADAGGVLPLIGLAFGIMVLAVGGTIDLVRAQVVRERMQWAIDAAALAAARESGNGAQKARAMDYFRANFPKGYMGTSGGNFEVRSVNTINGKGEGLEFSVSNLKMSSSFFAVGSRLSGGGNGMNNIKISGRARVNTMPTGPHDIVLAVDVSGSMDWKADSPSCVVSGDPGCAGTPTRMTQAKSAMRAFLDEMAGGKDIRIGIVPWDQKVNAGGVALGKGVHSATRMVANVTHTGNAVGLSNLCTNSLPCNPIQPMTFFRSSFSTIRQRINALEGEGNTDGALGIWWAREMLRNSNTRDWQNWSRPADMKSIIFLTDGINTKYWDAAGGGGMFDADDRFKTICENAKDAGIRIYTIGYNMNHAGSDFATARATLKSCASRIEHPTECNQHPGHSGEERRVCFFNSQSIGNLRQAFEDIAKTMMTMRLVK